MTHTRFLFSKSLGAGSGNYVTNVFNAPKLMSSANRKEYMAVDMSGNAQLYTIGMRIFGTKARGIITAAPNVYTTAKAIKAFHEAREEMYSRAGIKLKELGYGKSLRPYLDVAHNTGAAGYEIDSESGSLSPHFQGQEWTYSRAAVSTPIEESGSTGAQGFDLVDTYAFTILGNSVTEDTTAEDPDASGSGADQDSFVTVGMVAEWLDSFKRKATHSETTSGIAPTIDPDNALLQLMSQQGADKEEVLEIAEDSMKEQRPWDLSGAAYTSAVNCGYTDTNLNGADYIVFKAPCGLFNLTLQNDSSGTETIISQFDVLDIEDM